MGDLRLVDMNIVIEDALEKADLSLDRDVVIDEDTNLKVVFVRSSHNRHTALVIGNEDGCTKVLMAKTVTKEGIENVNRHN